MSLRGSKSYVWFESDILGQGASSTVYKARHKQSGHLYAVKVFNTLSFRQPPHVQRREFDVMNKISHENIVKLLDVEEETTTRMKVIIMELCVGGSLLNLLEQPSNSYGFEENEFFTVMFHVASGLQYLRELGIVHRDIKPGNILLYKGEDGSHIYKLTDFGAARELKGEEQFMSLYGTEEYLFPDMYARAVLRKPSDNQFDASVDLWSLGVTLYHTATGDLPFKPYRGRSDKMTMYKITTEKPSGVISGVQHQENGPIEYSRELPDTCLLSKGATLMVTPMLAGLMESDLTKMWNFTKFFAHVHNIRQQRLFHVFNTADGMLLHIYINPEDRMAQFQDAIAKQTDIPASKQHLILHNKNVTEYISAMLPTKQYPATSDDDPVMLFFKDMKSTSGVADFPPLKLPTLPASTSRDFKLQNDLNEVKSISKIIYFIKMKVNCYHHSQDLITLAAKEFMFHLCSVLHQVHIFCQQFAILLEQTEKEVNWLDTEHQGNVRLLTKLVEDGYLFPSVMEKYQAEGDKICGEHKKTLSSIRESASEPLSMVKVFYEQVINSNQVDWKQVSRHSCQNKLKCMRKTKLLYEEVEKTLNSFRSDRKKRSLQRNEEQIHIYEKHKATRNFENATYMLKSSCYARTENMCIQFSKWFSGPCEINQKLSQYESLLSLLVSSHRKLSEDLNESHSLLLDKMRTIQGQLKNTEDDYLLVQKEDLNLPPAVEDHSSFGGMRKPWDNIRREVESLKARLKENGKLLKELQHNSR